MTTNINLRPENSIVRTFVVATERRDKSLYPNPSDFTYTLPLTLTNVVGVAVRDFKFGNELLINNSNKTLTVYGDSGLVDGVVTLTPGDYNNNITSLLSHINDQLSVYGVQFTVNNTTQKIQLTFTKNDINDYFAIQYSPVLRILGFDNGILIYRSSAPAFSQFSVTPVLTTATAVNSYDVYNNKSEMVVRITDVETVLSNDAVTNRCTTILFNTTDGKTIRQCQDHYTPLLQTQSRLQNLRIKLLNMDGDYFDTVNNEAIFVIEFYCLQC